MPRDTPPLAVLIDADNVLARHAEAILKEIGMIGEPALRRAYGDWSSQQPAGWKTAARVGGRMCRGRWTGTCKERSRLTR